LYLAIAKYDYVFAENGLVAYQNGKLFFEDVCLFIFPDFIYLFIK
jgi:hypothetical protein